LAEVQKKNKIQREVGTKAFQPTTNTNYNVINLQKVRVCFLEKGLKTKCNGAEDARLLREIEERLRPRSACEEAQLPPRGKRASVAQWNDLVFKLNYIKKHR
jgi:hypothetical protein